MRSLVERTYCQALPSFQQSCVYIYCIYIYICFSGHIYIYIYVYPHISLGLWGLKPENGEMFMAPETTSADSVWAGKALRVAHRGASGCKKSGECLWMCLHGRVSVSGYQH